MSRKRRIVTLNDLKNDNYEEATNFRDAETTANAVGSNDYSNNNYCKPIGQGHTAPPRIPLCVIPNLSQSDACQRILHRIHDEFGPIIQRRGYNVTSISELCCCGDGLDHRPGTKKKCRKMGANVWGYNQTTFFRSGARGKTLHAIHLRLRNAQNHSRLNSWEDVAGTMAHELAHCEHQNHNQAFYKLMEEILEEHATLQAQRLSSSSTNHPAAAAAATLPSEGGHRLGGNSSTAGRSRLLGEFTTGRKLGGQRGQTSARELAARAAESRRKQMEQLRRLIERSKEPCVIEIFDDDDDDDKVEPLQENEVTVVETPNHKRRAKNSQQGTKLKERHQNKPSKKREEKSNNSVIDLTEMRRESTSHPGRKPTRAKHKNVPVGSSSNEADAIDLTATTTPVRQSWACGRCTYQNQASTSLCAMCHGPRCTAM